MRIERVSQAREPAIDAEAPKTLAHDAALPAGGKTLPPESRPAVEEVRRAAASIDRYLRQSGRELSFSVDRVTGRTVVSVRDPATGNLIRQVPSEEALRIARNLELAEPSLIRERA